MRSIVLRSLPVLVVVLIALPIAAQDQAVPAVWRQQQIDFGYHGFTTFYTCDGLESRVEAILRALGALDVKAVASGCFSNGPSASPRVSLRVRTPFEATAEVLAELRKTRTTEELKARLRGEPLQQNTVQFAATWKAVNLTPGRFGIDPGECELVEQLNRKVFPKLAIRVVKNDVSCVPHQRNLSQPRLQLEALTALPAPDEKISRAF